MCFPKVYCLQFSERYQISYLDNKCCKYIKVLQLGYTCHYVSQRFWAVVFVLLTCPLIFFQVCATNFLYTSDVIEMKPDKYVVR